MGDGSRRPVWIWGNPDSPSKKELSLPGAHSWWAMPRRLCLQPGYCFMVCFFFCKAIVLKQRTWGFRKAGESLWLQRWRKRPESLGWRKQSWCFPQTGNSWWLDGNVQIKKKQGTLQWHHLQPPCCAQPGWWLGPTTKNASFLSLILNYSIRLQVWGPLD